MSYFTVNKKNKISPFQNTISYLGGSAIQTIIDNPITAYRQLVQQYAKNNKGENISPKQAVKEANRVFFKSPLQLSLSGLKPRLVGILFKRIPKFGILLSYDFMTGGNGEPGLGAATAASVLSAPFINPIRMIEKQQRTSLKLEGKQKLITDIIKESAAKQYKPLFRGTMPLMGHSLASATLGLVGQPKLQKYIQTNLGEKTSLSRGASNLISSACVTPIYVFVTNPLSRLEVIMQTSSINKNNITLPQAVGELATDMKKFGVSGIFRGQGIGIVKGIVSLTLFHEGRLFLTDSFKKYNGADE